MNVGSRILLGSLLLCASAIHSSAAELGARAALELANDAAHVWAQDSHLVYVENDEDVNAIGDAARWGYLYYSPSRDTWRSYSTADGKIVAAGDLGFHFDAPPLEFDWIDSGRAFQSAEAQAGRSFRKESGGHLRSMILIRGAFHHRKPDRSTWTFVYDAEGAPSLFIVVDAESGDVVRSWRG